MDAKATIQYVCAVLLIVSSIALASCQALILEGIDNGTLMYIAQAFLLAGSIFGLDYYVRKLTHLLENDKHQNAQGNPQ